MANQAAVAIQNGRLFAETRRLADELEQPRWLTGQLNWPVNSAIPRTLLRI